MALASVDRSETATPRVAISSTTEDLDSHRIAAAEVARELGFEPLLLERPAGSDGSVQEITRQVAEADLLLAIVGWQRGEMPAPEQGGDGRRSWTAWEISAALSRAQPLVVLMAGDGWPESLREEDPEVRAWLLDFRGDLHSLAVFFGPEPEDADSPLPVFHELIRRELIRHQPSQPQETLWVDATGLRPQRWPPPEVPETPYPVLLPYRHPDLLAGREHELAEVEQLLRLPVPILGLYAPSGAGKSSLLAAGLVPRLDAAGMAVSFDRHPSEPGLAGRLIGDLLDADESNALKVAEEDYRGFVDRLLTAHNLTSSPPLLILDQVEDLLRPPTGASGRSRRARALAGMLLAASVQRQPGCDGPLCRWLLAYRQEFHGEVFLWLGDVLREARSLGLVGAGTLPHDLSGPERFHAWSLPPLGTPRAGSANPIAEATGVFQAVVEKPLELRRDDGTPRYPWRFSAGGAQRLATAFGEARLARPQAPLTPELQVVLAHLLERAVPSPDGKEILVEVPETPRELISQALEQHVRRALDMAFPTDRHTGSSEAARLGRTRALLALRELADASGRRGDGLTAQELARAIGRDGREVLEKLATPQTRLVVAERQAGEWAYVLSNSRLAEVLVRLVDEERGQVGLELDAELLRLRRFVALRSELFAAGEVAHATQVPASSRRRIEQHTAALLWGDTRQQWWQACQQRFRAERQRVAMQCALLTIAMLAIVVGVGWIVIDQSKRRQASLAANLQEISHGEPEAAFKAVHRLLVEWQAEPKKQPVAKLVDRIVEPPAPASVSHRITQALRQRQEPLDILERGIGGLDPGEERKRAVLKVAGAALPLIVEDAPDDPVRIASLVQALDLFAPAGKLTQDLRNRALESLRRRFKPPPPPSPGDSNWTRISADAPRMGAGPGESLGDRDRENEQPRHRATLAAFRIGIHEVTNAEFRQLFPNHAKGQDGRLPAVNMTWYQAYTYAAWLGGRLPTEAEAEYVTTLSGGSPTHRSDLHTGFRIVLPETIED